MKEGFANMVRRMIVKPEKSWPRTSIATTYLTFSGPHVRYVALKIYRRDFLADEEMLRKFQERATSLRTSHVPGLAFPLEFGAADSRFYQVMELLPGVSLARVVEQAGPLSPEAAIRLGRMLLHSVRQLVQDHEIKPVITPQRVQIWPQPEADWCAGMADYDPRPARNPFSTPELTAVEELMSLIRYARFGKPSDSRDVLPRIQAGFPNLRCLRPHSTNWKSGSLAFPGSPLMRRSCPSATFPWSRSRGSGSPPFFRTVTPIMG